MSRPVRILARTAAALAAVAIVLAVAAIFVYRSAWFRDRVHERIVSEVERATGGRAEIGSFRFDWRTLTANVGHFVLHGTEPAGTRPFFRADLIRVNLKVLSMMHRDVDIMSLTVMRPALSIVVRPDGSSNVPRPRFETRGRAFVQEIIRLKIRHIALHHGWLNYNAERIPLDLEGDRLETALAFNSLGSYGGEVSISELVLNTPAAQGLKFNASANVALTAGGLHVLDAAIHMPHSTVEASGDLVNWANPTGSFAVHAQIAVEDLSRQLRLRVSDKGVVGFNGVAGFDAAGPRLSGWAIGRGVNFHSKTIQIEDASFRANAHITPSRASFTDLTVSVLEGTFAGSALLEDWNHFRVEGQARGVSIRQLAKAQHQPITAWEGSLTGPVKASGFFTATGTRDLVADAKLDVKPAEGGPGISGTLQFSYDQRAGALQVARSQLITGQSKATFSGTLGDVLSVDLESRDIDDVLPLFRLAGAKPPSSIPVKLIRNGSARVRATVTGPLSDPQIAGHLDLGAFEYAKQPFDRLSADFALTPTLLDVRNVAVQHEKMSLAGAGSLRLDDWQPVNASSVSGTFSVRNGDIARLLAEAGNNYPVAGSFSGKVTLAGTLGQPALSAGVNASGITAWGESISRAQADVRYSDRLLEIANGTADADGGRARFSGTWTHAAGRFDNGSLTFRASGGAITLERLAHVHDLQRGIGGTLNFEAAGTAQLAGQRVDLQSLNGSAAVTNATLDGKPAGSATLGFNTAEKKLNVSADATFRDTRLHGNGQWRLEDDYPGSAEVTLAPVTFATLNMIVSEVRGQPAPELPFQGMVAGAATITGPLRNPDALRAQVRLEQVRLTPNPASEEAATLPENLFLQNSGPVLFDVTKSAAEIRSARFTAPDTVITASGRVGFGEQNPWNTQIDGAIDLRVLRIFHPDLLASGSSTVSVSIRGALAQPQVRGRLELRNASLYVQDLPNGLDKANGVIQFDRTRATIQSLSGESGGGKVSVTGFVGFSTPILTYRLAARAEGVRYRSPQGASITADALIDLTGTSQSSLVSGNVTLTKAAFTPSTDIGSILAEAARPAATPAQPNAHFSGVRLDVHVESAQTLELQTSLARGLRADVDLRVRGTPQRPVVLGNITVNRGQIEFFGNSYSINHGEVNFVNTLLIEPVLNLDLETRERGVTVDIILTGPLNRLNLSYRSDPPLRSEQILALLAVGRAPNSTGTLASEQATSQTSALGANDVLEQALTAPTSGRLERFFGVSHIKIDPQLTDITTVPQARLTLEQQISKDVTLTYTTNLTRTQEQLVQVEWDLNRKWSVVATRDENGVFGVDFQYRRRF